ncbi:MAG: hypothetical protein WC479_01880 [Candidatus Izemoplasmatales bacterium]|nr:hypothetical protein [Candidatus Izemoplasmatales bacterium]MDD3864896.1 hypothetical protein [Candidatus Izemoplasmatales bacterium]
MKFTFKNIMIYLIGLAFLGVCVTLMLKTNLGMDAWDAFYRNLNIGIPLAYKYLNPLIALILLPIAYAIQKKKITLWILFPLVVSTYVGWIIDLLELVVPSVATMGLFWNLLYLGGSLFICAIGLNMVTYCHFPLPALDELCYGIGVLIHSTYGRGKLIGEMLALVLTVIFGIIFGHYEQWFYIGAATIIFGVAIGPLIDLFKNSVYKILEAIK